MAILQLTRVYPIHKILRKAKLREIQLNDLLDAFSDESQDEMNDSDPQSTVPTNLPRPGRYYATGVPIRSRGRRRKIRNMRN